MVIGGWWTSLGYRSATFLETTSHQGRTCIPQSIGEGFVGIALVASRLPRLYLVVVTLLQIFTSCKTCNANWKQGSFTFKVKAAPFQTCWQQRCGTTFFLFLVCVTLFHLSLPLCKSLVDNFASFMQTIADNLLATTAIAGRFKCVSPSFKTCCTLMAVMLF